MERNHAFIRERNIQQNQGPVEQHGITEAGAFSTGKKNEEYTKLIEVTSLFRAKHTSILSGVKTWIA